MRTICLVLLVLVSFIFLNGCVFLVSKRIVQEIEFKNLTDDIVEIVSYKSKSGILLEKNNSAVIDVSDTDYIKIFFSDSNIFFEYDLSELDLLANTDKKKSGICAMGHIHWVYSSTINKDKTLSFTRLDQHGELIDVNFKPMIRQ